MNYDTASEAPAGETLAVGLGWFSIALGVAELAAPHSVARFIGVAPTERTIATLRAYGAREVGAGMAILAQPDRAAWLWSRAAGDALDLATLAAAPTTHRGRATFAAAAVIGVAALDVLCARQLGEQADGDEFSDRRAGSGWLAGADRTVRVTEAITINQPLELVENQWDRGADLPESLRRLTRGGGDGPERTTVEFRHAPVDRGTEVRVELEYSPRGGAVGAALAKVFGGDPTGQLRHDLRRFKQIVETGEVVLSEGPALWRPAQPAEDVQDIRHAAGLEV
jgi:hypothetical protein